MKVAKLHNQIQAFAWGSQSYLPCLLGYENPQQKPQAELWMGVHPRAESCVEAVAEGSSGRTPLSQYLMDNCGKMDSGLGSATAAKYQGLPFLFKVLAAGQPLSIQAHPNKAQAEAGFARENADGIALDAPQRNYKDANHKPEVTLALTPFWAMCGFLPLDAIRQNFNRFNHSNPAVDLSFADHQSFFSSLMNLQAQQKAELLDLALRDCAKSPQNYGADVARWVARLAEFYPGDIGALAPLYLHLLCLQPGQAIYLPAGILHAYLEGSAMELMANSDNVLRGGLTPKHQDIPELMRTLHFEAFPLQIIEAREMDLQRSYYPSTAAEFRLERWCLRPEDSALYFPSKHPVMLAFVYQGCVELNGISLKQGQSCIIPASSGEITANVHGGQEGEQDAILFVASAKEI